MKRANDYKLANKNMHYICKNFLQEFGAKFTWKNDGTDSMLDIGCGPGDITIKYIEPILPTNYKRLVGLDLSESMIEDAIKNYEENKIQFVQCNIEQDIDECTLEKLGQFDHAVTIKTLMWISDLKCALKNIYKLLCPGGEFAFSYYYKTLPSELFSLMSKNPKWSKYYQNVSRGRMHMAASKSECLDYLKDIGFRPIEIKLNKCKDTEFTVEAFKGLICSIDPVVNQLPNKLQEDYLEDIVYLARSITLKKYPNLPENSIMEFCYEIQGFAVK